MINSLGIVCLYDSDGYIDEYIFHLLDDLKINISRLAIVCNGFIEKASLGKLMEYSKDVFVRDNTGFDGTAFKDTILKFLGIDIIREYDGLLLINDTCFGPLYPLRSVFEKMSLKNYDFWGITEQLDAEVSLSATDKMYIPGHIQGYFVYINETLLHSDDFVEFWETMPEIKTHSEAVMNYEIRFSQFFKDRGYRTGAYVDPMLFSRGRHVSSFPNYIYHDYDILVEQGVSPFIKKRHFTFDLSDVLIYSYGENPRKTLEYVNNNTDYNIDLILKHMIRTAHISDLRHALHLDYILPAKVREIKDNIVGDTNAAVIAYVSNEELAGKFLPYFRQLSGNMQLVIVPHHSINYDKLTEALRKQGIKHSMLLCAASNAIDALLFVCNKLFSSYEFICFIHDDVRDKKEDSTSLIQIYPHVEKSYINMIIENLIVSPEYIDNVIRCFRRNPRLGILAPPRPYFAHYFGKSIESWGENYEVAKEFANGVGLKCRMSPTKQPYIVGAVCWFRTDALKHLSSFNHREYDFTVGTSMRSVMDLIIPFVAQHEGYLSGVLMSDTYATIHSVNYDYMMSNPRLISKEVFYAETRFQNEREILEFCMNNKAVYIYGAGLAAKKCFSLIINRVNNFMGFIVSDGHRKDVVNPGLVIYSVSEVCLQEEDGVILALNSINQAEVIPMLSQKGVSNYILLES